ncbi:unnamed protein product [Closterium sp. NIES-65]|nr:unnamed protein product [Closterium sp. NIES-65]
MICPFMLTADGHENQFGTNHVGECREATTWVSAGEQQPRGLIAPHLHCLPLPLSSVPSAPPPPLFPSIPFPPSSAHIPHPIASHVVPPLGHFLLTNLLLPKLKETAKQEGAEARIVIVSSAAYQFPYPEAISVLLTNTLPHPPSSPLSPSCLSLYACEQEEGAGVTVNALHPGVIDTNPSRHIVPPGTIWHTLGRMVFQPGVPVGAATSCFLAAHPSVAGASGGYYADSRAAEGKATALSKDMELAGKLWELSEQVASKQ